MNGAAGHKKLFRDFRNLEIPNSKFDTTIAKELIFLFLDDRNADVQYVVFYL